MAFQSPVSRYNGLFKKQWLIFTQAGKEILIMAKIVIKDLAEDITLDKAAMAKITGGKAYGGIIPGYRNYTMQRRRFIAQRLPRK